MSLSLLTFDNEIMQIICMNINERKLLLSLVYHVKDYIKY